MDFERVLAQVADHLDSRGYPWAVAGGLALQLHGFARNTQDIDLVVESQTQPGLVAFMESQGYETLHVSPGFSNHLHADAVFGRVDFIYVDAGTAGRLFPACRRMSWGSGRSLPVPLPEHLVAMKVHAMKNDPSRVFREMADIQYLMHLPDVEPSRVRVYFEKAGLADRYDELLRTL